MNIMEYGRIGYFSANAPKILKTCILVDFDLKITNPKSERGGRTPFPRYPPFTAPCKSTGNLGVANVIYYFVSKS